MEVRGRLLGDNVVLVKILVVVYRDILDKNMLPFAYL